MQLMIVVLCAVAAAVSSLEQVHFKIPPESLTKLHSIAVPCAQQNNVDVAIIRILGEPTLPRDAATNNFLHCYSINSGFVKEDGHIVVERLAGVIGEHPRIGEFREALKKCNEITKENPIATVVAMHTCYSTTSPILFVF